MNWLIVGLGNPEPKYETTRHNAGFLLIDQFADERSASFSSGKFKNLQTKASFEGRDLILSKPLTFMNLSGESVAPTAKFFKIAPSRIIALYDDLDMEFGAVKRKKGGGHGGHNGIRDMIRCLGTADFHRIKVGIGRPSGKQSVSSWVLQSFSDEQLLELQKSVYDAVLLRMKEIFKASKT